ncbi:right-handed parallel beta-helix repeat-containing protein [Stappia sp.]|uniref:right-handed parallel beta-helix repeat-containing protein n=1 Tax=Stappia sp. TaxID=1870903 RepID=UPI0032D96250
MAAPWQPWAEAGAQAGARSSAFLEGFMPLAQDADSLVFLDMRLDYDTDNRGATAFGLGLREIVGEDLILGANAFIDVVRTDNDNVFAGATLGLEAFTSIFDLRLNAHIPIGGSAGAGSSIASTGTVSVIGNQLTEGRVRTDRTEALLYGLTGEIGALFDSPFGAGQSIRPYAGGYLYDREGYDTRSGARLGLEYRVDDVLSLAGSRFTLGAEVVFDSEDDVDAIASARLRIPLFAGRNGGGALGEGRMSALRDRMDEGVRRDTGIRTGEKGRSTAIAGIPVVNPATGRTYGQVYYASQGASGSGSFADPTSLATAVANAGTDGIVVVLGAGGAVTTSGVTLQSGQILTGGGETIATRLSDGTTANFLLEGTNGTIDGDPGVTTVTLADGVTIRDLTIQGGATAIGGTNVSDFTLTDLSVQNATDGIRVTGATNATVSNVSFSGITGTSLFLNNQSANISNITITGGTTGLSIANNTGTTTLSDITVTGVSGDAVTFAANSGTIAVENLATDGSGGDALSISGGGTYGFTGTTQLANAGGDGIDLTGTSNATLTFGDVDVTALGAGTGLNLAGGDATVTIQSLDVSGTGTAGSRGVDLSGTQNGRSVTVTNGGTIAGVETGIVLGSNGAAAAAPDAVFTWGGGDIGGTAFSLDGVGVNAADGAYAFGTTGFSAPFNFTASTTTNYFVAATATGTGDGSSTENRASIATAIGAAAGLGTVNFILINDGSALDTSGLTFQLSDDQTVDTFGDGRTFASNGLLISANITGANLPSGSTAISDPTGLGAATLTNSSGAVATLSLANGNAVRNLTIGSAAGTALSGSGIAGVTLEGLTIGGSAGAIVNGVALSDVSGAVTLTDVEISGATGSGLSLTDVSGTVTGTNVDITGTTALSVTGGDAAISFDAASSVTNTGGTAVAITNRIGGSFSHFGAIMSDGAGAGGITVSGAMAASDVTFGGQVSLGTATALGAGAGVSLDNNGQASDIAFTGGLEIATDGQAGLTATGGGTLAIADAGAESIAATGAQALSLDGIALAAGGVSFDSLSSTGSATTGVTLNGLSGDAFAVTGTTTVTNATGDGIALAGIASAATFGATTVTGAGGAGVALAGNTGATVFGMTTVTDAGGDGIDITGNAGTTTFATTAVDHGAGVAGIDINGTNAQVTFGATTISDLRDGTTGIDLSGANTPASFGVTTITGRTNASAVGIDLSSTTGGQTVSFATGSSITFTGTGAAVGVELSSGNSAATSANAEFTFGDGSGTDANGTNSTISVGANGATVGVKGLVSTSGTYDFDDVAFTGVAEFGATGNTFVSAAATTGAGDGSFFNPLSVADADTLATATTFVFLDGTYDFTTLNGGTGFSLASGQNVTGFDNANAVSIGGAPVNVSGLASVTVARGDAGTGTGGAIAIANSGAADLFLLAGDNDVTNVSLTGAGGTGDVLDITGSGPIAIEGVTVSNVGAGRAVFDVNAATGTLTLSGNAIDVAGTLLDLDGGSADVTLARGTLPNGGAAGTLSGGALTLANTTGGTIALTDVTLTGSASLTDVSGTVTGTNVDITGTTALSVTGGDAAISFDAASSVTNTGGTAVAITNRIGGSFSHFGAIASDGAGAGGITVSGATAASDVTFGGQVSLGTATALGAGAGVSLDNNGQASDIAFTGGLEIATDGQAGLTATGGGTLAIADAGAESIAATGAQALSLDGIALAAGGVSFDSLSSTGSATTGVTLNGLSGGAFAVTGATTVTNATGDGIALAGTASAATFGATTVTGVGDDGLDLNDVTGAVTFAGPVTIAGATDDGIDIQDSFDADVTFQDTVTISGSGGNGVELNGFNTAGTSAGTLTFAGLLDIDTSTGTGISISDRVGTLTFGQVDIDTVGTGGVVVSGATLDGTLSFAQLDVNGGAGSQVGFGVAGGSSGAIDIDGGTIEAIDGEAVGLIGSSVTLTYSGTVTQANATNELLLVSDGDTSTATFEAGSTLTASDGTGLQFDNADGTYSFLGTTTLNGGDAGLDILNGSAGTLQFAATTSITDPSGTAVSIQNSSADLTYAGTITQTNAVTAILASNNTGGSATFSGGVTANTSTATAVDLQTNAGAAFSFTGDLDIDTTTGTGFLASDSGTLGIAAGGATSILSTAGQALSLSGTALAAGGVSFDSLSSTGSGTTGVTLNGLSGGAFAVTGATTVSGSTNAGLQLGGNASDITFAGPTSVTMTNAAAAVAVTGTTTGATTFNDLDIALNAAGATGLDLTGATVDADLTASDFDVTGTGATGSTGVDLSGTTGTGTIRLGDADPGGESATIAGVDIGVRFSAATDTALVFGDGEDSDDQGSSISAATWAIRNGKDVTAGTYDFDDVTSFTGALDFNSSPGDQLVFVAANATGDGSGSDVDNRATIATADAITTANVIFVLIDDGATIVDNDGFTLSDDQTMASFGNGRTFATSGLDIDTTLFSGVPGAADTISDPTSNGAATLTSAATTTLTAGNNAVLQDFILGNTGAGGSALLASGTANLNVTGLTVSNGSTATGITLNSVTGTVAFENTSVTTNGDGIVTSGTDVTFNGTTSGTLSSMTGDILTVNSGSATFNGAVTMTGAAGSTGNGLVVAGGTTTFNNTLTVTHGGTGDGIVQSGGTTAFNGAVTVTQTGTGGGISQTGGTSAFGGGLAVDTANGAGVSASGGATIGVAATGGAETITTGTGTALDLANVSIGAGGLNFDTLAVTAGGADDGISLDTVDTTNGGIVLGSAALAGHTGTAIDLDAITGANGLTLTSADLDLGAGGTGVAVGGANTTIALGTGTANGVTGLVVDGGATGVTVSQTAGTLDIGTTATGQLRIGATTAPTGAGVEIGANSGGTIAIGNATNASTLRAGGDAVAVTNSDADVTLTGLDINAAGGDGIRVTDDDATGSFTLAGTNTIDNTGGDGIDIAGASASISGVTIGGSATGPSDDITGDGVRVTDGGQSITARLDNVMVALAGQAGISLDGSGAGSIVVTSFNGNAVTAAGGAGVSMTDVAFDADGGLTGGGDANFTGDTVTGGDLAIGQGGTVAGAGLVLANVSGDLAFGALDVTSAGTGLDVTGSGAFNAGAGSGFRLATTSGTVNSTAAAGVLFDPFTADVTLTSITANGGTTGVLLEDISGSFTVTGTTDVNGATGDGLVLRGNDASVTFSGTTTVTDAGGNGITLDGNTGAVTFGATTIDMGTGAGARGIGYVNSNAATSFGATIIQDIGAAGTQVGIDFNGAELTGAATYASVALSGPDTSTDSIGVDLRGIDGDQAVTLGTVGATDSTSDTPSSITDLHRGVVIDPTAAVQFTFGDGAPGGPDEASSITVNGQAGAYTVDAGGGTLNASSFDFSDVAFTGDANFPVSPTSVLFVSETGGAIAAGVHNLNIALSADQVLTVTEAEGLTNTGQTFVFVAHTAAGTIDVSGGGADGFTLQEGQSLDGFADGNSVSFGSIKPANIEGDFGTTGGSVTQNVVTASNGNAGATSIIAAAGDNTIANTTFNAAGLTTGEAAILVSGITNAAHTVTLDNLEIGGIGAGAIGVALDDNNAAITLTDVDLIGSNAGTALSVDAGTASTAAISVDAASDIDGTTGTVVAIGAGGRDVTVNSALSASGNTEKVIDIAGQSAGTIQFGTVSSATATGDSVIEVTGQTGGTVTFGNVSITGYGDGGGDTAVALAGSGGTINLADVDITTTDGAGLSATGGGLSVQATSGDIDVSGGTALGLSGVTANAFALTSITGNGGGTTGTGVLLNNLGTTSSFTVSGATTLDNYTGFGIEIANLSEATQTIGFGAVNINTTVGQVAATGDGVSIDTLSATGVDIDFGAVTIGNATNQTDTGLSIGNITAAANDIDVDFASLALTNLDEAFLVDSFDATGRTITVAGTTTIADAATTGIAVTNSAGNVTFNDRTTILNDAAGANASGVDLGTSAGGANTGAYTFNGVDITVNGTGAFGFRATDSGSVTINDPASNNQITSNNGTALFINPTQISIDLETVTSSNASGSGVFITGGDALGGAGATGLDIANLTVTNSGGAGLRITNSTGTYSFGTTTIDNASGAGTAGDGVDIVGGAGVTTTVNFTNGLEITTTSGTGFVADGSTGTLTLNVANAGTESITTQTGRILRMDQIGIGGTGVSFDTLTAPGTVTGGDAISLFDVDGGTFSGGAVSIAGTAVFGDGITISGFSSSTFNFASATINNTAEDGIALSGANGAVTFGTVDIDGTTGDGIDITNAVNAVTINGGTIGATDDPAGIGVDINGGSGPVTIAAAVSKTTAGDIVEITGRTAGTVALTGAITGSGASGGIDVSGNSGGGIDFQDDLNLSGSGATVSVQTNTGGTTTFSGTSKIINTGTGNAVTLANNAGTVSFTNGGLDIDTTSGTGFSATGGGTVNVTGGGNSIASTGTGRLLVMNGVAVGSTVTFASLTGTGTISGDAVSLTNVSGGTVDGGTVTIAGTSGGGTGIALASNAATVQFGTTSVTDATGDAIDLNANSGTVTFGATTIASPTGIGIDVAGSNGAIAFGDVDITGLGATTGVDLSGGTVDAQITFATLDITGTSTAGSTGMDLTDYDNGQDVVTTGSGTIQDVETGIDLTNANIADGVTFRYGDGSGTNPGTESTIDTAGVGADNPIVITGLSSTGDYNFLDVGFGGSDTSGLSGGGGGGTVFWVAASATGAGDGSSAANAGLISTADGLTGVDTPTYIVLLNDPTGGQDTINLGSVAFTLEADQSLLSFHTQDSFSFGGGAPANVQLTGITGGTTITNPNTGSGAPVLTSSGTTTVTVADGSVIDGLEIAHTGGSGQAVLSSDLDGSFTVQNSLIQASTSGDAAILVERSSGFSGTTVGLIDNNTIDTNDAGAGIRALLNASTGAPDLQITISNNTFQGTDPNIGIAVGGGVSATACVDIVGNIDVTGAAHSITVSALFGFDLELAGYTGPADNTAAIQTFLAGRNTVTGGASTINVQAGLGGTVGPGPATCTQP